jgi:hypothetical protein
MSRIIQLTLALWAAGALVILSSITYTLLTAS